MEALSGRCIATGMKATKNTVTKNARIAALLHVGGLLKRFPRAACFCAFLRSSGLGGRLVRPRGSTMPAAVPGGFGRRLRLVWAIGIRRVVRRVRRRARTGPLGALLFHRS